MKVLIAALLATIFLTSVLLYSASQTLPVKELRRRARGPRSSSAAKIYKMTSYGGSLAILLWLIGAGSMSALFIMAVHFSWWLAVVLVLVASWIVVAAGPVHAGGQLWRTASMPAPAVSWLLAYLQPVLGRLNKLGQLRSRHAHSVYEKEDLLELLGQQPERPDNRVDQAALQLASRALTFGDKKVSSAMLPIGKVKMVVAGDAIGPQLMDELHKSGQQYFPVVKNVSKSAKPEIIGLLYINDVMRLAEGGDVNQIMQKNINFINEEHNLHQALRAFIKTQSHMLIVTNKFEEIAGVLLLSQVLEEILGPAADDNFDGYGDMLTVAGMVDKLEQQKPTEPEPEPQPEEPDQPPPTDPTVPA